MVFYISGASGFVGANLTEYLSRSSIATRVISRLLLVSGDLKFEQGSSVVHLAGKAHDMRRVSQASDYYEANYELTKKLYQSFLRSDAKSFIFISSVKAAADTVDGILSEDHITNPQTHYGKSKLMAEEYIKSIPLPANKFYYILRPCMIHGPGNKGNLNLLYQLINKGIPYPLAAFENKRSFLSVENLCYMITQLINKSSPSGIYNLADDDPLSTNEVIEIISKSIQRKPRLWSIPKTIIAGFAKIGDLLGLPLNSERISKLTENYVVSNDKIKSVIGSELPVTSRKGLQITAKSFI